MISVTPNKKKKPMKAKIIPTTEQCAAYVRENYKPIAGREFTAAMEMAKIKLTKILNARK
jgi:hypothetical protein